jgi:hypothetical protein
MKSSSLIMTSLFVLIGAVAPHPSYFFLTKSWLLSCKPCEAVLVECEKCVKSSCQECISKITFTNCRRCGEDIIQQSDESFYCDNEVSMHQQACLISCRSRDVLPFHRAGTCDPYNGLCVCCKK